MLLRNPISTTKRFFQRTLESFKSFLGGGENSNYQRLPKTPPFNPLLCARNSLNMEEEDEFAPIPDPPRKKQLDGEQRKMQPENIAEASSKQRIKEEMSFKKSSSPLKAVQKQRGNESMGDRRRAEERREVKICLVAKRLKEMERVDKGNVDHLLDIEEVFHYYSRLTCTAYLDIVDKYFMDLYAEFFSVEQSMQVGNPTICKVLKV